MIAAAAAIFNVMMTKRSTSNVELQKWRRQQVGELGARVIATVHAVVDTWQAIACGRVIMLGVSGETRERARGEVRDLTKQFCEQMDTIELAVAELDMLAGRDVVAYSSYLLSVLDSLRQVVRQAYEPEGSNEVWGDHEQMCLEVHAALFELVDVMRSDLGIEKRTIFRVKPEYRAQIQTDQ
ncbi:hypothetical protein Q5425_39715 [Amycolatopsis sp. A133]|uniref:hypothetical protein n=1 Tax=Amycolatopsis sp. A133 TaxID=3064472 RepID=UPI0027FCBAAE|nr:hypothetical protein [Amycolatopsis sp. A133]MDQ7809889.1 hypothetical protein [Amycolatopsis sp. A133]